MWGTSGTRSGTFVGLKFTVSSASGELDGQTLTHEVRTMEGCENDKPLSTDVIAMMELTRDDIASIHSILVFDEPEAIHELDFSDLSGTMGVEMRLHISLGRCNKVSTVTNS